MAAEAGLFLGLWFRKPLAIGAICPSSEHLGDALGRMLDLHRAGVVLELGAGTGSLTRGLLRAGCPPERLVVLEREPPLAALLRRDFPDVAAVIEGEATRLGRYLNERGVRELATVVRACRSSGFRRRTSARSCSAAWTGWVRAAASCR
jgi:phosphatidylethanolamine/phosphatidyl-N-methylethanolamine N-methyltransferase